MPKPRWGWFAVAMLAFMTGIWLVNAGFARFDGGSGPPGGLWVGLLGLIAVWSFGKAFFNFRIPPRDQG
ncbi:MAG: hypothetical protein QM711_06700 [Micropruina sp.]|uniref:hypothetical protein n=1 Tax=Micropruina sp. TaxID=2737536 RepID=UPI0039E28065